MEYNIILLPGFCIRIQLAETMMSMMSSLPWRWKLKMLNLSAMVYFLVLSLGSLAVGVIVTLPEVYGDDPSTLYRCRLAASYIFVVMMLNYVCLRYYSRHSVLRADRCPLPRTVTAEGEGQVCRTCEIPTPPRAKHCPLCNACVLKRDHHCFFGGCCVGFHNQRYFLVFCLYSSMGSFYSMAVTFSYLSLNYASILSWNFYTYLVPWVVWYWANGQVHISVMAMVIFSYFCVLTFFGSAYFLVSQCVLLARGQTSYEFMKGIKRYRCSPGESLRSVFGPWWFLNLVVPLPFLRSADNGFDWKVAAHDFNKQM
ncbi:palmitoyltransferase ZDHHC22-like [Babylonia areolata]|uniref:palmitoyltransferase ZDHHC22-like n=1 Tax=Babylonia areolata TaxID=304850 RepID=UPI003FD3AD43